MGRALLAIEPPDGGVAEHVLALARGLGEHGWEIEVAGPATTTIYERLEAAAIPVHRIDSLRRGYGRPIEELRAARALSRLLRAGRFDLIHCHSSKIGLLGRLAARRLPLPAVYTPHGFGFVGDIGHARRALVPVVERILARSTAALICVCEAEVQRARRHRIAPEDVIHRIYNGVEPCAGGEAAPAAELGLPRGCMVAGTIAVFRREKQVELLIDAAPRILATVPDAAVVVIGDGPLRSMVERRVAERGLDEHPRFRLLCGFTPPSARYLRRLDLFVLPSAWEAFPIAILEALACGVPQVATDVGGVGEAVTSETGILVPPGDPARLADAAIALLRDPGRREAMAIASADRHRASFTLPRMVAETDRLYRQVVGH